MVFSAVPPHGGRRTPGGFGHQRSVRAALPGSGSTVGRSSYRRRPPWKRRIQSDARPDGIGRLCSRASLPDGAGRTASGRGKQLRQRPAVDRRTAPATADGRSAGRACAGSGRKRCDGAGIWQPPPPVATRFHDHFRGSQPGGDRITRRSGRRLHTQRLCHSRPLPPDRGANRPDQRQGRARSGAPGRQPGRGRGGFPKPERHLLSAG